MSNPSAPRKRSHREWAVLVLMPIIGNVLLAAFIFTRVPATLGPDRVDPTPASPSPGVAGLPRSELTSILAAVERSTGHRYACDGPWRSSDGWSNWSCRTSDALVVLQGTGGRQIARFDATWFGFDVTTTDLPAWAAAIQRVPEVADASQAWVATKLGGVASTEILAVHLRTGGARGALNLTAAV